MSDSERLRDDMAFTVWDRTAQIAAQLRIVERAKRRAEEMQRDALAVVAVPPPLVPVFDMPCGFMAYSVESFGQDVSLSFVSILFGEPRP